MNTNNCTCPDGYFGQWGYHVSGCPADPYSVPEPADVDLRGYNGQFKALVYSEFQSLSHPVSGMARHGMLSHIEFFLWMQLKQRTMWTVSELKMPTEGPCLVETDNGIKKWWPCIEGGHDYWMDDPEDPKGEMYWVEGTWWVPYPERLDP